MIETRDRDKDDRPVGHRAELGLLHFEQLANNLPESFWLIDIAAKQVVFVNEAYERLWGGRMEDLRRDRFSWLSCVHPDDRPRLRRVIAENRFGGVNETLRALHPDGSVRWLQLRSFAMADDHGRIHSVGGIALDITQVVAQRDELSASIAINRSILDALPAHIALLDQDGCILAVNAGWRQFAEENDYPDDTAGVGLNYLSLCASSGVATAESSAHIEAGLRAVLDGRQSEYSTVYPCHGNTTERWFRLLATPLHNPGRGAVVMHINVTESVKAERQLAQAAHYDALTGLPNRLLVKDRIEQALAAANRQHTKVAVLVIDLDRFKLVNDTFGHGVGDALLVAAADRIATALRESDTVGRMGADEFAIVIPDLESSEDAAMAAQRIMDALARPIHAEGQELYAQASVGIALFPEDGSEAQTLIRNADTAMYRAKEVGRNNLQFYTASLNARAQGQLQMVIDLRRALERDEFCLHYQPKVSCVSGEIVGFEALLRWQHPTLGLVPPDRFIPLLEDTGGIIPVGAWVLRQACDQAVAWHRLGVGTPSVAVNLSVRQLQQSDLVALIRDELARSGLDPAALELEITESMLMHNVEDSIATLDALKQLGVRISVDDFGTGYSSLSYLKRFPLDSVKVDRSFVQDIVADPGDVSITRAVITLAHNLKLRVVAEGVETEAQLALLASNGCDEIQGYYFSRPIPVAETEAMLLAGRCLPANLLHAHGTHLPAAEALPSLAVPAAPMSTPTTGGLQGLLSRTVLDVTQEVLNFFPWPMLGVDENGLVIAINPQAGNWLGNAALLGEAARDCLPEPLLGILALRDSRPRRVIIAHHAHHVFCRPLGTAEQPRGWLLIALPEERS